MGCRRLIKAGYTFYANVAGLVVQVAACLWLVPALRVPGAAAAMLIGSVAVLIVRGFYYAREMRSA